MNINLISLIHITHLDVIPAMEPMLVEPMRLARSCCCCVVLSWEREELIWASSCCCCAAVSPLLALVRSCWAAIRLCISMLDIK